jgi:hypothetical protein
MSSAAIHAATSGAPPYREVAVTLRTTTERLARELASPTDDPPEWSSFEWDVARAAAAMQGISALLANRLRWHGPPRWEEFLREQVRQSLLRDIRIGELLAQIAAGARRESVGVLALKGAALRALDIYPRGARPMGDIDLYAPAETFPAVARVLASLGYGEGFRTARHVVYRCGPPVTAPHVAGEHIDNPLKIELHGLVAEPLPVNTVDITARLTSSPLQPGLHGYASRAALMAHLLLHAAGNMRAHALRLIQLHDIARLSALFNAEDWCELVHRKNEMLWWAYPPLFLATKYCDVRVSHDVLEFLERVCPPVLARSARRWSLTDVSWSNLRISAFPGIAWSRSAGEAVRFARSRLLPSRVALDELAIATREQPQQAAVPWYTRSHSARIVRWAFGRPPRVQTMTSVLAALSDR